MLLQSLPSNTSLQTIIDVLVTTIERAFHGGKFLDGAFRSVSTDGQGKLAIGVGVVT